MITDEEIKRAAIESGLANLHIKHNEQSYYVTQLGKCELDRFARAIYQLGRQHQRESDAAYDFERPNAYSCARAIRANKENIGTVCGAIEAGQQCIAELKSENAKPKPEAELAIQRAQSILDKRTIERLHDANRALTERIKELEGGEGEYPDEFTYRRLSMVETLAVWGMVAAAVSFLTYLVYHYYAA